MNYTLNSPTDGHRIWKDNRIVNYQENLNSNSSDQNKYSGNNAINNYVTSTKESNQNISRAMLAKMPIDYQRPIFRSLSNENKLRIFVEKINLLINTENLNQQEIDHLKSILTFMKPEYYDREYSNLLNSFSENWRITASNNLNWSKEKISIYVASILNTKEFNNIINGVNDFEEPGFAQDCSCCSTSDYCFFSSCGRGACNGSLTGCGFLWGNVCDGLCGYDVFNPPHTKTNPVY